MHNHQIKSEKTHDWFEMQTWNLRLCMEKKILQLFDWLPKSVSDHKILMCMCLVPTPRVGT